MASYDGWKTRNPADEELGPEPAQENRRHLLVALENELLSPEHGSILEEVVVKRGAHEEVEDHRRMVGLMSTTDHRQRAIATIVDRMTYLELIGFAEDFFDAQSSIDI